MTENRFDYTNYDDGTESIYDREEDEYYFNTNLDKIGEILNKLNDEIKELKNKINTYKSANKLQQETIKLLREDNGLINITNVELFKLEDEDD